MKRLIGLPAIQLSRNKLGKPLLLTAMGCLLMFAASAQAAYDVTIAASGASSGGAWVGNTWTPSASGSTVLASEVATHLGSGATIIDTTGAGAENGDIVVNGAVAWSANLLTLNAQRHITIKASLSGSGSASLALAYGQGAVAAGNAGVYTLSNGAKISLPAGANFSTKLGNNVAATPWTVITALGAAGSVTTTDLQGMNGNKAGKYVLGADIDASSTSGWNDNGSGGFYGFTPAPRRRLAASWPRRPPPPFRDRRRPRPRRQRALHQPLDHQLHRPVRSTQRRTGA